MPRPHPHSMHARSISCLNCGVFGQNISQISNMHRWKSTRCQYSLALLPSFKWMFLTDAVSQICIFYFLKRTFTPFPASLHFQNPPSPLQGPATQATRCDLHLLSSPVGINGCDVPRRRTHRRCAAPAAGVRSVLLVSNRTREAIGNARHSRPRPPSHIRNLSTQKETVGINPSDDVSEEWILVLLYSQALWLLVWQSSAALNTLAKYMFEGQRSSLLMSVLQSYALLLLHYMWLSHWCSWM